MDKEKIYKRLDQAEMIWSFYLHTHPNELEIIEHSFGGTLF